ncbi:hypothetical protein GGR06_001255 [Bacteroides reticulotermitis]|uniref:SHOCT domain-containing protein n=1 Tax=Bacteroides reticulotermitis TaxID=1133319 RepID=A0A840D542_9BACE|nr:DUF4870 domain-containing protein [Bacteroides reticulotermitis]MBB4043473.1 hypothetical protein [Bacteroides reticulotermitis]
MDYKKLDELNRLRQDGALTDEEFDREKQKLFEEDALNSNRPVEERPLGLQESSYLGLMSFLIMVPYVGWIIPIVLWVLGKNSSEQIDKQGKYILNWYITWFIFGGVFLLIMLAGFPSAFFGGNFIGPLFWIAPIAIAYGILTLAFPIIGGIKGLNGQVWKYPLSIPFLK